MVAARATKRLRAVGCGLLAIGCGLLAAGCDVFAPRDPAPPEGSAGTYVQPDTPDLVVENLTAAVAELSPPNYRRSLAPGFTFSPAASALAQDPGLWAGWSRADEERSFTTLASAAEGTTPELRLIDATVEVGAERYVLDATYALTVNHRRPDIPMTAQGRLVWTITQGEDGLWSLSEWVDRQLGASPSWSDLKAAFAQ